MPTPLKEWIKSREVTRYMAMSQKQSSHEFFFRNPPRTVWGNRDLFASPADGVITTQGRYLPDDDMIDVKGADVTINTLLGPCGIDSPAFVSAIFMSAADVHWNRASTDCIMSRHALPPIRTMNQPMLFAERDLLDSGLIRKGIFGFMSTNARVVNKCFCGALRYTYYLVQIADSDVNCIVPLKPDPVATFRQNERFGQIMWGSMCVLILPLDDRFNFTPVCKAGDHVEATNDQIVKIDRRG